MPKFEVVVVTEYAVVIETDDQDEIDQIEKIAIDLVSSGDYDWSSTEVESVREIES